MVNIHVNGFYSVWDMYHRAQCVIQYNVCSFGGEHTTVHVNGFYSVWDMYHRAQCVIQYNVCSFGGEHTCKWFLQCMEYVLHKGNTSKG